jgi:hypothetical protein
LEETSERREAHEAQVAQEWKELAKTAPDSDDIQRWTKEREETRKSNEHPYANYDPNDDREDDREDDRPRVEVTRVWDVKPGVCKAVRPSTQVNNE